MTVFHPRGFLRDLPAKPRFYLTRAECRTHTGLDDSEIVETPYTGPVTPEFIVQPEEINPLPPGFIEAFAALPAEEPVIPVEMNPEGSSAVPSLPVQKPVKKSTKSRA